MTFYLNNNSIYIAEETNYVSAENMPIHQEHTQVLLDSYYLNENEKRYFIEQDFIPFVDENFYKTELFNKKYDCLIYSLLMDYSQELYEHKKYKVKLPFGSYNNFWTEEKNDKEIIEAYKKRNIFISKQMLHNFRKEFTHIGRINKSEFINNLKKIRELISEDIPIIFINGAELESPNINEKEAKNRHIEMNKALKSFVDNTPNTYILDVANIVTNDWQLTDNIRHYKREIYKKLADELVFLLGNIFKEEITNKFTFKMKIKSMIINTYLFKQLSKQIVNIKQKYKEL